MSSELVARAVLHRIADAQPEITLEDGAAVVTESVAIRAMEDFAERAFSDVETLRARIEALEAENAELKKYAHEATKVITNLAGGGSELFGKELSGVFLADLSACAKRIRDRHERIHKICRDIARRAREGGNADG